MEAATEPGMLVRTRTCGVCAAPGFVRMSRAGYRAWKGGALLQDAEPDLPVDQREQLISGTHPACWAELTGGLDPDDV